MVVGAGNFYVAAGRAEKYALGSLRGSQKPVIHVPVYLPHLAARCSAEQHLPLILVVKDVLGVIERGSDGPRRARAIFAAAHQPAGGVVPRQARAGQPLRLAES